MVEDHGKSEGSRGQFQKKKKLIYQTFAKEVVFALGPNFLLGRPRLFLIHFKYFKTVEALMFSSIIHVSPHIADASELLAT